MQQMNVPLLVLQILYGRGHGYEYGYDYRDNICSADSDYVLTFYHLKNVDNLSFDCTKIIIDSPFYLWEID